MSVLRFHRRRTWRRFFLLTLIAASSVLFGLIANVFTVQSAICREDFIDRTWSEQPSTPAGLPNPAVSPMCSPEIIAELERFIGQRVVLLRLHDAEEKIMLSDPSVKSIHSSIDFKKRSIVATVVRRIPVARIAASDPFDVSLAIDEDGMVFDGIVSDVLPLIVWDGFSTLSVGQRVPDQLDRAVILVLQLPTILGVFGTVNIRAGSLEVATVEGTLVMFSLAQDPTVKLAALQLVLDQSKIEKDIYRVIDLRYERPIVTE